MIAGATGAGLFIASANTQHTITNSTTHYDIVRINHSNHTTSSNSQWHHIYGARRLQTPITRAPVWSFPCCLPHYDSKLFFFQKYFEPIFLGGAAKRGLSLFQGELNQPYSPIKGHIPYWSYTRLDDK